MQTVKNKDIVSHWLRKKGWVLFKHQEDVLIKINSKKNILLISPTGTGKTLSAFLPSIVDLEKNSMKNVLHTLYISPLKSLTYDIEKNIIQSIKEININTDIQARTGDTGNSKKKTNF